MGCCASHYETPTSAEAVAVRVTDGEISPPAAFIVDAESRKAAEANVAQMILMLLGERSRADVLRRLRINFLLDVETGSDQEFAKRAAHIFVVAQGTVAAGQPLEGSMRVAKYASSPSTGGLPLHPRMGESQTHHYVRSANRLVPPFPSGLQSCVFAAGCFWGTEKGFWRLPGVYSTAVGYVDGTVAQPTYKQVCSGRTGHTEATLVVWDPSQISLADLLRRFFDCHDPTQGDAQGNDVGSQYRSGIYTADDEQATVARACLTAYDGVLRRQGYGPITSEVKVRSEFWYAEGYHQQYLAKPGARLYCSAEPTGHPVPPLSEWGLPAALSAKFAPLLPPTFWKAYDGTIYTPDTPVSLDESALAEARERREQQVKDAATSEAQLRSDGSVEGLIRFCGGCGFHARAEELASHLRDVAGARFGLVQDVGVTGNFDVEVRTRGGGGEGGEGGSEGAFALVHSKVRRGDGFVDSAAKMEAILEALGGAKAPEEAAGFVERVMPAALRFEPIERAAREAEAAAGEAAEAMAARVADEVRFYTSMAPVVLFSKSYCPYCNSAKQICQAQGVTPVAIELDRRADGVGMLQHLHQLTGQRTVPNIWIRGKFIGGSTELKAAVAAGALAGIGTKQVLDFAKFASIGKCHAADGVPCLCGAGPAELEKKLQEERAQRQAVLVAQLEAKRAAEAKYPNCVIGDETLMATKANGTSATPVVGDLRWGVDRATAERISNHNRHFAEQAGYFESTAFITDGRERAKTSAEPFVFYDSNTRAPLFHIGGEGGRQWGAFADESAAHGWPSFRDGDVNWDHVRVLPNGEVVSTAGTHLGHNLPDKKGNRFCINLVSVAATPAT